MYSSVLQDRLQKEREARELARQEEEKQEEATRDRKGRREARERDKAKNIEKMADKKNAARGKTRSSRRKNVLSKTEVQDINKTKKTKHAKKIGQPRIVTGASMYDYQIHGIEWMASLYENGLNGILADEMGLGKTLQTIAFLGFLIEKQVGGPYLVVVPLSTLNNWENEFRKFAPSIPVLKFYGDKEERAALWKGIRVEYEMRGLKKRGGEGGYVETFPVVITTYETVVMETRRLQGITWKYLIVDEGHRIKNVNSLLLKKLKLLDTSNRLLLTGTPLQNNLMELWSLLNFLLPDVFSDLQMFQSWFDEGDNGNGGFGSESRSAELVETLHSILKPFLLRRLKSEVYSNLPDKREYHIYIQMAPLQEAVENRLRAHARAINKKKTAKDTPPEVVPEPLGKRVRRQVLREDVVDTFDADLGSDDDGVSDDDDFEIEDTKAKKKQKVSNAEGGSSEEDYSEGSSGSDDNDDDDESEEGETEDEGIKRPKPPVSKYSLNSPPPSKAAPLTQLQKNIIEGKVKWVQNKWVNKTVEEMAIATGNPVPPPPAPKVEKVKEVVDLDAEADAPSSDAPSTDAPSTDAPAAPSTPASDTSSGSVIPSLQPTDPDAASHAIEQVGHMMMPPRNYYSAPDGKWYPLFMHPLFPTRKKPGAGSFIAYTPPGGVAGDAAAAASPAATSTAASPSAVKTNGATPSTPDRGILDTVSESVAKARFKAGMVKLGVKPDPKPQGAVDEYMQRLERLKVLRAKEEAEEAAKSESLQVEADKSAAAAKARGEDPVEAYIAKLRTMYAKSPTPNDGVIDLDDIYAPVLPSSDVDSKMDSEIAALRAETFKSLKGGADDGDSDILRQVKADMAAEQSAKRASGEKTEQPTKMEVMDKVDEVVKKMFEDKLKADGGEVPVPEVKPVVPEVKPVTKTETKNHMKSIANPTRMFLDSADARDKPAKPKTAEPLKTVDAPAKSAPVKAVEAVKAAETAANESISISSDSDSDAFASATEELEDVPVKAKTEEKTEVKAEVKDEVKDEVKPSVKAEVKDESMIIEIDSDEDVKPVKTDVKKEVKREVKELVKKEVKEQVKEESRLDSVTTSRDISTLPSREISPDSDLPEATREFLSSIEFSKISTSMTLANLRKVANSPYLVKFPWGEEEPVDERIITDSGKMKVFDQLTEQLLARGHKILVFSQFTSTLDVLTEWCEFRKLRYCMLIGSMGISERQEMIDAFNSPEGPSIFLITTRAGGTGINLTAADSVIIFDSDWNPQQDKQAIDRSHRIGQKNPCVIYRLISTNTMEEMLVRVASDKKRLDEMVIQAGDYSGFSADKKAADIDKTFLREIMTGQSDYEAHEGIEEISPELMEILLDRSDECYKAHRDKTASLPKSIEVLIQDKSDKPQTIEDKKEEKKEDEEKDEEKEEDEEEED